MDYKRKNDSPFELIKEQLMEKINNKERCQEYLWSIGQSLYRLSYSFIHSDNDKYSKYLAKSLMNLLPDTFTLKYKKGSDLATYIDEDQFLFIFFDADIYTRLFAKELCYKLFHRSLGKLRQKDLFEFRTYALENANRMESDKRLDDAGHMQWIFKEWSRSKGE